MRSHSLNGWTGIVFCGLALCTSLMPIHGEDPPGSLVLESMLSNSPPDNKEVPRVPEPGGTPQPRERLGIGLNYTGGQVRWRLSSRWAMEGRVQFGSADSDFGRVRSNVFGLRAYRFLPFGQHERISWYLGGEGAYAKASSNSYNYSTTGFAFGGFGGLEYRLLSRLSVGADIGPYVISLKEQQTGLTSTGLDFVVNTALIFYLFC